MKMRSRMKKHTLKFLSIFLSLFIWVYVLNSEKVKFEKTVHLEYILPVDMVFAQKPPQEVTFLIEGPRAFVRTVAEREDRLVIDINRANSRKKLNFTVDINPAGLNLPFGMTVERVLPRKLNIRLEKKASKIVPLRAAFTGQLPDKLSLSNITLEPSSVEVYGPRSLIAKLKELTTRPVELETLMGSGPVQVEVNLKDQRLSLSSGQSVKLSYQLKAQAANFLLKEHPINFVSESSKYSAKVKTASLKLLVPEKVLKNRSNVSSSIQVVADLPQGAKGRIEIPLRVILPPSMLLLDITPKTIIVNIQ